MAKVTYFDNCEICREMKEADEQERDLTEKELLAAFGRQEMINKENKKLTPE